MCLLQTNSYRARHWSAYYRSSLLYHYMFVHQHFCCFPLFTNLLNSFSEGFSVDVFTVYRKIVRELGELIIYLPCSWKENAQYSNHVWSGAWQKCCVRQSFNCIGSVDLLVFRRRVGSKMSSHIGLSLTLVFTAYYTVHIKVNII
jgi:hypothetical protein